MSSPFFSPSEPAFLFSSPTSVFLSLRVFILACSCPPCILEGFTAPYTAQQGKAMQEVREENRKRTIK